VGFFLGYRFLNPLRLAYGFFFGGGGVCLSFSLFHILLVALFFVSFFDIFDETDQNNQKSIGKSIPAYEF
jgi:hypothetical protein